MAEVSQLTFTFKEVVEALLKKQGIHEGIWALFVRFGIKGANIGETDADIKPTAVIPILQIGLQQFEKETNISVDAAKVNPKPTS